MHGKNELRPRETAKAPNFKLQVADIWYTIQGEGPFFGCPAVFIRLTGCNLACTFCDTVWDDKNDKYLEPLEIVRQVNELAKPTNDRRQCDLVVITGGEPMRQDLLTLCSGLVANGYHIQIETAGTFWQPDLEPYLIEMYDGDTVPANITLVCSPKTKHVHPKIAEHCNHWKYVIQYYKVNIFDGLPAGCTQTITEPMMERAIGKEQIANAKEHNPESIAENGLFQLAAGSKIFGGPARPPMDNDSLHFSSRITIWLSPCDEGDEKINARNIAKVGELALKFGWRAQVQLHKILNLP